MKSILTVLLIAAMMTSGLCLYSCNKDEEGKNDATESNVTTKEDRETEENDIESVKDIFVIDDGIDISLTETTKDYVVQPGAVIAKNPRVTVKDNGEGCWLYVKAESTLPEYIIYEIDAAWTSLPGYDGVYYIENPEEGEYPVLTKDQLTVDSDVTDVSDADDAILSFTAYAIQLESSDDPTVAYEKILEKLK